MLIAAGMLTLVIWVYLVLGRGGFWRIYPAPSGLIRAGKDSSENGAQVSPVRIAVIIPARNEADVVDRTVRSLLQQKGGQRIHIFLVDDASTDGTAQTARAAAIAEDQAQNLTIMDGSPLPSGWSGKLWALICEISRSQNPATFFFRSKCATT